MYSTAQAEKRLTSSLKPRKGNHQTALVATAMTSYLRHQPDGSCRSANHADLTIVQISNPACLGWRPKPWRFYPTRFPVFYTTWTYIHRLGLCSCFLWPVGVHYTVKRLSIFKPGVNLCDRLFLVACTTCVPLDNYPTQTSASPTAGSSSCESPDFLPSLSISAFLKPEIGQWFSDIWYYYHADFMSVGAVGSATRLGEGVCTVAL